MAVSVSRIYMLWANRTQGDVQIQMLSKMAQSKKLFHQAVIMSGNAVLTSRTLAHQDAIYRMFLKHLRIPDEITALEKVERLRVVPVEELLQAYSCTGSPLPNWQATVDGFLLEEQPKASILSQLDYGPHVKRIIIGDCQREVGSWAFDRHCWLTNYNRRLSGAGKSQRESGRLEKFVDY